MNYEVTTVGSSGSTVTVPVEAYGEVMDRVAMALSSEYIVSITVEKI